MDRPKTDRTLGWIIEDEVIRVCDLDDARLLSYINYSRRHIITTKLTTGCTPLAYLVYRYLVDEAKERGIYPDEIDDSNLEP
ncbi:MAG TPA: hypothetical protein VIK75_06540 [Calditerricola sp.]